MLCALVGRNCDKCLARIGLGERQAPRIAIHMEASVADPEGANYSGAGRLRVADSIFRDWTPARWARRLKMDKKFSLKDGRLTVSSAGIYYIYAQVWTISLGLTVNTFPDQLPG